MPDSQSCSSCGSALAEVSPVPLCEDCLRATSRDFGRGTLDESIPGIVPPTESVDGRPTVDFVPAPADGIAPAEADEPEETGFRALSGWEQAQIGELGRRGYRVRAKIGDGGFGVVFLAVDAAERIVAVKMLHAMLCQDRYRQRFAVEANALTRLSDPGLVQLFHFDVSAPDPMLVMEYVPGGTLAKKLRTQPVFAADEAAEAIRQLATVVHKVHEAGVVHRDIKPSNILIDAEGRMKLGDFGLAKRLDRDDDLTPTGRGIGGTPEYSAPEQFRASGDCDGRADIYALGATLYRLLTGRPVFERGQDGDFVAVVMRVISDPPVPPRKLQPSIPRELEAVCLKCLAKSPTDRYHTAGDLADDLRAWQTGAMTKARPRSLAARAWGHAKRVPKFPVAMILIALLGLGAAFIMLNKGDPHSESEVLAALQRQYDSEGRLDLQGPTGRPRWHRWDMGGSVLTDSPLSDQACSFEALDYCALVLYPHAPSEHFLLSGEARIAVSRADDHPYAGFFHAAQSTKPPGDENAMVYSFVGLQFGDGPATQENRRMRFFDFHFLRSPGQPPGSFKNGLGDLPFVPSATLPGPWRKFEIEVWPDKVVPRIVLGDTRQDFHMASPRGVLDAETFRESASECNRQFQGNPNFKGLTAPKWDPRGAIGVWAHQAAVDFRNVSLIRQP